MRKKIIIILIALVILIVPYITLKVKKGNSIPILAYHDFMTRKDKERYAQNNKYTMEIEEFEKQMKYLHKKGYHTITYDKLIDYLNGKTKLDNKSFMITIDDGNLSSYYLAMPIIEKYNFDAIFFVIVDRIRSVSNKYDAAKPSYFGSDIINDIKQNHKNIYIGSHSTSLHQTINDKTPMELLSYEELLNDLKNSKEVLDTEAFAYPFGTYNQKFLKAVKDANFKVAFTFYPSGSAYKGMNPYKVSRLNINADTDFNTFKRYIHNSW